MQGSRLARGDLLRAQVLLDRHRVVGAALDGRVVGDDHALAAADPADAGDDAGATGTASSYIPVAASGLSSRNGLPGSSSRSTRSRTSSLPRSRCLRAGRLRAALAQPSQPLAQVVDELASSRRHRRQVSDH